VYFDAMTQFTFDPKSTTNVIADLKADELPFINGKIANALVDFTDNVDFTTSISQWEKNSLSGRVGDQPISKTDKISMLWETGNSITQKNTFKTCSYDMTDCYEARTVPVIFDIS
jgi:hypothetical protein